MVYTWTIAMQFSLEYCIDPKDHKYIKEYKAIAVEGASDQSSNQMPKTGWFALQDRGVPPEH